ncbi:methionyl-tRNA formyltransferase [bacterium]|jgi:methionyl-tRNA formyltransferase|nr:methionyl-tRNA formyltransferase [bacterium]MDP6756254.1 methionyl-tRNA formyltransferase [Patescibacteria group bacterium]|tara:strand:- start:11600 stop:12442 length:843 start_codon:yes stop_codon:yes gene_type:complete
MYKNYQIIFFGTPEFAVPTLKALIKAGFIDIKFVVTQPDKPVGRHHSKLVPSPIKKESQKAGIDVVDDITKIDPTGADLGILVAYGKIIPKKLINSFPKGILNLHPSLLPKYRGSSPIQVAILNQDDETGVTIMQLDDEMDHGPIITQEKVKLDKTETAGDLHDKLAKIGADLFIKILPDYIAGKIKPKEQDHAKASFTEKLTKQVGKINWKKSKTEIEAHVRAMNPWPGAWTTYKNKKLIIWKMSKDGTPKEVQLEGKKRMPYSEFLKGNKGFNINDFS